jgi:hypothetical protein
MLLFNFTGNDGWAKRRPKMAQIAIQLHVKP